MQVKPLKKIVAEYLGSADSSSHEFVRLYNIARRGIENEFNLDITGSFKTELVDVNPNKTVAFPQWCSGFSKLGIVNNLGEFVTLKLNNQLANYHAIYFDKTARNAGVPVLTTFYDGDAVPTGSPYLFSNYYLNYVGSGGSYNLFGLASGTPTIGEYKIDVANNVILLDSRFPYASVLFEGLTNGFEDDANDYLIDVRAAEAMLNWIRWQNMVDLPKKYSQSQVQLASKRYYASKRVSRVRLNPVDLIAIQDAERASWTLTAKA